MNKHTQQIFYAAAYGRIEAVTYLLTALPDQGLGLQHGLQWVRGDVHGDTPLHAAASSGCGSCTRLLLEALKEHPNFSTNSGNLSRNTKGRVDRYYVCSSILLFQTNHI